MGAMMPNMYAQMQFQNRPLQPGAVLPQGGMPPRPAFPGMPGGGQGFGPPMGPPMPPQGGMWGGQAPQPQPWGGPPHPVMQPPPNMWGGQPPMQQPYPMPQGGMPPNYLAGLQRPQNF